MTHFYMPDAFSLTRLVQGVKPEAFPHHHNRNYVSKACMRHCMQQCASGLSASLQGINRGLLAWGGWSFKAQAEADRVKHTEIKDPNPPDSNDTHTN